MTLQSLAFRLLGAVAIVIVTFIGGCRHGENTIQTAWDNAVLAQSAAAKDVAIEQAGKTVEVITQYVDRVHVVHEQAKTIIKEIPVYVPSDPAACDLPGGFRLLHDAAATGNPLPNPAAIADAAPVSAQTVAGTVSENYESCRADAERLTALQAWADAVSGASPP
jgi:hypothetical protein